jgi:uncharacterized repeat protein (TIGR01451 family)
MVLSPTAAGTLTNLASVSGNEADPTPKDNSLTFTTPVTAATADLKLKAKIAVPNPLTVGSDLTFTFFVTNGGPSGATGVTLTDTLPANVTVVSATGGVTPVHGVLTFDIGTLAKGAQASVTMVLSPTAAGTLTNLASVSGNEADPTPKDNSLTFTTMAKLTPLVPPPSGFGAGRDAFVITLYVEILGREPEASGLRFWSGLLAAGARPRDVAVAIWNSPEHLALLLEGQAPIFGLLEALSDALGAAFRATDPPNPVPVGPLALNRR